MLYDAPGLAAGSGHDAAAMSAARARCRAAFRYFTLPGYPAFMENAGGSQVWWGGVQRRQHSEPAQRSWPARRRRASLALLWPSFDGAARCNLRAATATS
jgi:hypothetical protein